MATARHCASLVKHGQPLGEIALLVRTQRQMAELEFGLVRALCAL